MQRPHMSTGAWIFATAALVLAVGAPISYAAVNSTVAIGNTGTGNTTTATVTANHQLLTTTIAAKDVVRASGGSVGACPFYTPPAGKAIVVTSVTYNVFNNPVGNDFAAYLRDGCSGYADDVETTEADMSESHTFPIGLPMSSIGLTRSSSAGTGSAGVFITGYLIPVSQLPATAAAAKLPARLSRPTK